MASTKLTMSQLRKEVYRLQVANKNPKSKFYAQDCADLQAYNKTRNRKQLEETLGRLRYVPTAYEMKINCQFGGLPKL